MDWPCRDFNQGSTREQPTVDTTTVLMTINDDYCADDGYDGHRQTVLMVLMMVVMVIMKVAMVIMTVVMTTFLVVPVVK